MFAVLLASMIAEGVFLSPKDLARDSKKHRVLVFLSSSCPCSDAHVDHLSELSGKYDNVSFYGVISEPFTEKDKAYFTSSRIKFPVIRDDRQILVRRYKALKTPHATILSLSPTGEEIHYQGGVSDARRFDGAKKKFLATNLEDLSFKRDLSYKTGQSLGCYIRR